MITLYSKDNCQQCMATKRSFDRLGITYIEINVDHDQSARERLIAWGIRQAPVVDVDTPTHKQRWSGYKPDTIKALAAY